MNTKTIIICAIYTANLTNDSISLVSTKEEALALPQIDISSLNPKKNNINLQSITKFIFEKYVNLNFDWTQPKLIDIDLMYQEDLNLSTTAIYYGIYVPDNVILNNSYWLDIKPYVGHYDTLRKLVCML